MVEEVIWKDAVQEIVVGSISGAIGKVVEFPFDTVKVRLQYSQNFQPPLFTSTLDCVVKSFKKEGLYNGFYKGIMPPLFGAAAEVSCLFFSYKIAQDYYNSFLNRDIHHNLLLSEKILCGALSGTLTSFVLTPVELVKVKAQVSNLQNNRTITTSSVIKSIYQTHGLHGLWKGQVPTMFRESGGTAAWFGLYEFTLDTFKKIELSKGQISEKEFKHKDYELLVAGAMAGIGYNVSLFPVDTVKNIIQSQQNTTTLVGEANPTFYTIGKKIYANRGIAGFYSGLGVTLLKTIPASAILFYSYGKLKDTIVF